MGAPKKADWREERRKRAWQLKEEGWPQQDIAACAGYLVYLFEDDERKERTEGPFLLSSEAEEESALYH